MLFRIFGNDDKKRRSGAILEVCHENALSHNGLSLLWLDSRLWLWQFESDSLTVPKTVSPDRGSFRALAPPKKTYAP